MNTGEVVVGAGDADLVGDAVNVGARLESECQRGHVVVGEETWRSTRGRHNYDSLGQVHVKGRTAPVAVYQWLGHQSEAADCAVFVGRVDELQRLAAALDDTVAARAARLVTVIGDPGVGKSRLAAEFVGAQRGVRVVQARCDVEQTVALAPIVEVLRARDLDADIPVGVLERDRMLRDLKGLAAGVPGSVEETFWALRRFVEALASGGPLVIVLDDIHWADTLLLDFVEHLTEWVREVPVLVVALARPELREVRPDLVTVSRWVSEALHLGGLDPGATAELAAGVLGAARLPEDLLARLPSSTGGNPLFVRELVGMLVHDGVLVAEPAGWRLTIDVDAIAIPPTIQGLLASRLERLNGADRRVLEIASVVGTDFPPAAVCALEERGAAVMQVSLDRLRRLELAQPSGAYIGDEPVWRFHHVLIRDVAYRRLLKSDRANLHERLADWVAAGGASVAFDTDEMVARHLEAAHSYRVELGTHDEHTGDLALRSARCYLASARRALDRDELVSAGAQAARGAALAGDDEAVHAELLLVGCEAFLSAGDVAAGAPLVDDLDRIAGEVLAPWATCYRCQFVVYTDPERLLEADARLQGAIDEFGRRGDPAGLAKAHRVRASARARLGQVGDCEVDLFEALIAARQGGDHRQITAALGAAPNAALWGPSPVPKAGGRCLDVVRMQRMTTAAPSLEATSLRCLALLELLRGRPDKARSMLADARQVVADLGLRHGLMETELFAGIIELMVGDPGAAEPHFRTALEGLDALGVGADAGQAAALLARSVLAQGRIDDADHYATESEHLAGHNLKTAIAWRAVRAEILAAQGRHGKAVVMAREAVAVAADTDLVLDHAEACLALRRVLVAAGDTRGAAAAGRDAEALYAAKEAVTSITTSVEPIVAEAFSPTSATTAPTGSRLAFTNRASESVDAALLALQAHDVDGALAVHSDQFVYDDRRRLSGDPIEGIAGLRKASERLLEQYPHVEWRTLAVRGERLVLVSSRSSDDAGNETIIPCTCSRSAMTVGSPMRGASTGTTSKAPTANSSAATTPARARRTPQPGAVMLEIMIAHEPRRPRRNCSASSPPPICASKTDPARASRIARPQSFAPASRTSTTWWPRCGFGIRRSAGYHRPGASLRLEREAVGPDGEQYAWTRLIAGECRDGRLAWVCEFDLDDEDAAFAYAEERMRATASRLAVANRASETLEAGRLAMLAHDIDALVALYSDRFEYDDRRRLSGGPRDTPAALRAAVERLLAQYPHFEWRTLAVRGERLELHSSRWWDDAGNEATHLHVFEIGDDGRITYDGRFEEDDFEGAYRELERRYYAGEGAAFAEAGEVLTEVMIAMTQNDFGRRYNEFIVPELQIENRSRSPIPLRTATDLPASTEQLNTMVDSVRTWNSAVCWLSPTWSIGRTERQAVGPDGETYAWTYVIPTEIRDGRIVSIGVFDIEDEKQAFAYANERMRATEDND